MAGLCEGDNEPPGFLKASKKIDAESEELVRLVTHYSISVLEYLNEVFPQRWIGRGSPILPAPLDWPPLSPDLTTCDNAQ
ncbi:hypothetical protein ANN_06214 [Periplaneta americana]|uniref:Uncharacterized protein n=1 Tax=Periplaneta americana TaxID=6978 RepID=A0ABQ8TF78_PERAM|nr:hypothetical protein ANN_06214 [Periplaneta americana]